MSDILDQLFPRHPIDLGRSIDLDSPSETPRAERRDTFDEKIEWVRQMASDPFARPLLLQAMGLETDGPRTVGLPPLTSITALQATIFDNRAQQNRKRGDSDFGIAIEVWTDGSAATRAKRAGAVNVKLWRADELEHRLRKTRSRDLSPDWIAEMRDAVAANPDALFGPVIDRSCGFTYAEGQLVVCEMNGLASRLSVFHEGSALVIGEFTDTYANGKSLDGNRMATARVALADRDDGWATTRCRVF